MNFTYKRFNAGVAYVIDLMPIEKDDFWGAKTNTGTLTVSVGYEF